MADATLKEVMWRVREMTARMPPAGEAVTLALRVREGFTPYACSDARHGPFKPWDPAWQKPDWLHFVIVTGCITCGDGLQPGRLRCPACAQAVLTVLRKQAKDRANAE